MKIIPFVLVPLLLTSALSAQDSDIKLRDPKSGVAVTLPAGWSFAAGDKGMIAADNSKTAMVVLAAIEGSFGEAALDVETTLNRSVLRDVEVDRALIALDRERGGLEALVQVRGRGTNARGERVEFSALVVKSGDKAELVMGAWKGEEHGATVGSILDTIFVENPGGAGGLQLSETETGASVQMPEGWSTIASRKGLIAVSPDRTGMVMILPPQGDFDSTVKKAREMLRERVFKEIELGEFSAVSAIEAAASEATVKAVSASGSAVVRDDGAKVDFEVMVVRRPEADRGALVLGVWKDDAARAAVLKMLGSLKLRGK